ncbi:hypothetical protein N5923_09705 [Erwiniaceae bacterium BAC15a-03b]|uniref:Type IV secretion protein Rhs n=1 Tax=Winslowiella arboricola TaxID=2978220 RepID=A0A9J6PLW3_9GAMM|nr:hypothetical protein [Winslowiella arboricola]MCU5773856.1 hypothetical protein [Winslowiella arboricola]MCU5777766.1 hypothetical protein [Winslowiella arboricola]
MPALNTLAAPFFGTIFCALGQKMHAYFLTPRHSVILIISSAITQGMSIMVMPKGQSRPLTCGEVSLAKSVFKCGIIYSEVRIYHGSYFPFNMQSEDYAMAPNGNIYFMSKLYKDDFYIAFDTEQHIFIHEMAHIWQRQMGMSVRSRGLVSWAADYNYSLPNYHTLANYSMEQQAAIIADYFLLKRYGQASWQKGRSMTGIVGPDLMEKYENVLRYFLKDPRDRQSLWQR